MTSAMITTAYAFILTIRETMCGTQEVRKQQIDAVAAAIRVDHPSPNNKYDNDVDRSVKDAARILCKAAGYTIKEDE